MLCILSVIPLIIVRVMEAPDYICGISVGMLLIIIAVGVNLLIRTGMIKGSYDTLLQEGEFTKEQKQLKKNSIEYFWLLFTGNVPRGVFCEQSSQKTREVRRDIMRMHDFCASRSALL